MISQQRIEELVTEKLDGSDLFLVEVQIGIGNKILVEIDGDNGVGIDHCVSLSRHIEGSLDRDVEDFELSVTSSGLGRPLKIERQFAKNIGRTVALKKTDGMVVEGQMLSANDGVTLLMPAAKKKKLPEREEHFGADEISEVKVKIVFN